MLVFDIETGPLADDVLAEVFSFEPSPHPGEFDPGSVLYGNTKDEAKRAAKLKEKQDEHAAKVANHEASVTKAREEAWAKLVGRAALEAHTGQVLAIGLARDGSQAIINGATEAETLAKFWAKYKQCRQQQTKMVGSNIVGFDLPFLVRRSWMLKVDVPSTAFTYDGKWLNFDRQTFVDIRDIWLLGQKWSDCESTLDSMARALGCGRKTEGIGGADFARLWFGTPEEKQQATIYLLNDLKLTADVATRLGVI